MLDVFVEKALGEREPMALGPETKKIFFSFITET